MILFSTLLNINDNLTKERFIDLVTEWNNSSKREENRVPDVKWNGQTRIKFGADKVSLEIADYEAKGITAVRHEKIMDGAISWKSDFIVDFANKKIAIRLDRTYSEDALVLDAKFSTPHFITLLINHGYLEDDQDIPVIREPIYVCDENYGTIKHFLDRTEDYRLPIVYVSRAEDGAEPLSVSWLASRLKGAAHILVEKSIPECAKCRAAFGETEESFGAVRIYYPTPGMKRKRYRFRSSTGNMDQRLEKVIRNIIDYWNTQKVESFYTWQGLTNAMLNDSLKSQTMKKLEAETARQSAEEEVDRVYDAFDEDIKALQRKIEELTSANDSLQAENLGLRAKFSQSDASPILYQGDEEDFYPDEIKDMILGILTDALGKTETNTRRHDVLADILESNHFEGLAEDRRKRIKSLFKGYKNLSGSMKNELQSMGFQIDEDGKHYKITLAGDPRYMVTVGKTPSDARAGDNNAAAINKKML